MVILTGDTHGEFDRILDFCDTYDTTTEDVMVILGDAGINYYLDERDQQTKFQLAQLPITLFCVHGNHEERPEELPTYEEKRWRGGLVYCEQDYPDLLFAKDGELYEFGEKKAVVIGGAYSVDKYYRLANGLPWFPTEQPDDVIKAAVERQLDKADWQVDYVFSHTVPLRYIPQHGFLPTIDQRTVDRSTEEWLDGLEGRLHYER
jgi:3-oxoacid CoA-transferase subunit A